MLDHRKIATIIVGHAEPEGESSADYLRPLAEELLSAVREGSSEKVADAFYAMFLACERQPHDEAEDGEP